MNVRRTTDEQAEVQAVFHNPGDELRIRDTGAKKAKEQINILAIHGMFSSPCSVQKFTEKSLECAQALRASSCAGQIGR
jgi:hypothetical protein